MQTHNLDDLATAADDLARHLTNWIIRDRVELPTDPALSLDRLKDVLRWWHREVRLAQLHEPTVLDLAQAQTRLTVGHLFDQAKLIVDQAGNENYGLRATYHVVQPGGLRGLQRAYDVRALPLRTGGAACVTGETIPETLENLRRELGVAR